MSHREDGPKRNLVEGRAAYVADLAPPGTLYAAFVRSVNPFGSIRHIDISEASRVDGVRKVFTGADLANSVRSLPIVAPGQPAQTWFPLATNRVRYVGEPLAVVVADDPYAAEDGAELVFADIEPFSPIASVASALTGQSINADLDTNILFETHKTGGDPDKAFSDAAVVIERSFQQARQTPLPLETRGVLASTDIYNQTLTIHTSTQIPHIVRTGIAKSLDRPETTVRVVTPQVGGGFGLKTQVFPEEVVVSWLAVEVGRPIKWIEDRRENLIASGHAHEVTVDARIASDSSGRLLGLDIAVTADVGAYSIYPFSASLEPMTTAGFVLAGYRIPSIRMRARGVATNKCPSGAYRGVGIPPGVFAGERMLELLSKELGVDRIDIRKRNLVSSDEMPYRTPLGAEWDKGDYHEAFSQVVERSDLRQLEAERDQRRESAVVLGLGVVFFNEHSGTGSAAYRARGVTIVPGFDAARIVVDPDGRVLVYASSADAGQDHAAAFRSAVSSELSITQTRIDVIEGDTATCPAGSGTFASRMGSSQLSAVVLAARKLRKRLNVVAGAVLDCAPTNVVVADMRYRDPSSGRNCSFDEVVAAAHLRSAAFAPRSDFEPGLEVQGSFDLPLPTYPYGAHVAAVELDRETFQVKVQRYIGVEDCGRVLNEDAVHEQLVGAISMGIGNALLEEIHYDEEGQIRTSTLLDYLVPLATDMITPELHRIEHRTDRTPLGTRGVGEAGTIGAICSVGLAVADAISILGGEMNRLPMSPGAIYTAISKSRQGTYS